MAREKKVIIIGRRCDVPMAKSKGMYKHCDKQCQRCFCCIERDEDGQEAHVNYKKEDRRSK